MKTVYLIWSTLLSILCDQGLIFKVLLKVTKENIPLKLEVAFLPLKPNLYLDNKVTAFWQFSNNDKKLTQSAFWN